MLTKICAGRSSCKVLLLLWIAHKLTAPITINTSPLCYSDFFQQDIRIHNLSYHTTTRTLNILQTNTSVNTLRYKLSVKLPHNAVFAATQWNLSEPEAVSRRQDWQALGHPTPISQSGSPPDHSLNHTYLISSWFPLSRTRMTPRSTPGPPSHTCLTPVPPPD